MIERDDELRQDRLWTIPQPVQQRALLGLDTSDYRSFLLSGLYCGMTTLFLVLFGVYAATSGEPRHAVVLFTFAGSNLLGFGLIWFGGWHWLARHFTISMLVLLCLYLFHTGGLQNTGPLYYFVVPSAAVFLHGRLRGSLWVIVLLLLTIAIWKGMFGFDVDRYDNVFVSRTIAICLIITLLACIPEHFRLRAEHNLLVSYSDLESLSYGDLATGLGNRRLLEKVLQMEFNRNQRYGSASTVIFMEPDPIVGSVPGTEVDNGHLQAVLAGVLRRNLRVQDCAGRWENNRFLLILPEVGVDGAKKLAARLLGEVRAQNHAFGKYPVQVSASIGIAALDKSSLAQVLDRAVDGLLEAKRKGGDSYVPA